MLHSLANCSDAGLGFPDQSLSLSSLRSNQYVPVSAYTREVAQPRSVREVRLQLLGETERESGLACAAVTCHGDQPVGRDKVAAEGRPTESRPPFDESVQALVPAGASAGTTPSC